MPKVSVLLAVRNMESTIGEAIKSFRLQSLTDFKLYVICNNCTDSTVILAEMAAAGDPRVLVYESTADGPFAARNEFLGRLDCEYMAVMDGDDICVPTRLERQAAFLDSNGQHSAVGSRIATVGARYRVPAMVTSADDYDNAIGVLNPVCHPTLMCRLSAFEKVGGYCTEMSVGMDFEFAARLRMEGKIENINEVLLLYRIHAGQITNQRRDRQVAAAAKVLNSYYSRELNRQASKTEVFQQMLYRSLKLPLGMKRQCYRALRDYLK